MSEFPGQVYNDYAMVQAVWLEERLNFMHFEHKPPDQIQTAINETNEGPTASGGRYPRCESFPTR